MEKSLKEIFELGEQMQQTLDADNLEAFYDLVDQREKLVAQLKRPTHAEQVIMDAADTHALEKQFSSILETLNKKERQMMEQLHQLDQFKKAGKSYNTSIKRRQFINRKLMG